ncbi:MAG: dihydrolipoamide acetyltransferase family protein [Christensenella sp.]|uniref:dihydrolipoamide acetyltransferase family protein n=1 Tax=Christensenella sp. TaxID=1935934 RepID=UPI002B1F0C3B|nr:dihydrolipoamide acetyltransferase family protein [Christensenella sp.]MEA5003290.1 dihydrolipoamide acetyltransferase family protein [Christensenella sp.]
MARKMALPKIGVNMTEAVIAKWLVKVGDKVADGDAIIEAETDKSTQEIYATESGIVAKLLASEGETVECNYDIMVLVDEGETYTEEAQAAPAAAPEEKAAVAVETKPVPAAVPAVQTAGGRVRISPLAKKMALENGIDFHVVPPETPGARIVKNDVLRFIKSGGAASAPSAGENLEVIPMSGIRRTIAERMTKSTLEKPCVGLNTTADATALLALRSKYKEKGIKISMDAILARLAAKALSVHRNINTILEGDNYLVKRDVNVGVAVDTDRGLMVPVVKNADKKSLVEVADELAGMVADAQNARLGTDAMSGGTFTITNLGMFGVEEFAPIINPPECCILGVGALKKVFVPDENDQPKLTTTFQMTLVFDHRIVDGAPAAKFLRDLKELVEMPELLI